MKKYSTALHLFRRDLRLEDNSSLIAALKSSKRVIPCFILDKRQIGNNPYKSEKCIQFMLSSLRELDNKLKKKQSKLYLFYGTAEEIVSRLLEELNIEAIFVNRDYTPFSRKRDVEIEKICHKNKVDFHCYADALLHEPEEILKSDKQPYTVFSHYLRKASKLLVAKPHHNNYKNYYKRSLSYENRHVFKQILKKYNSIISLRGGRAEALVLLKNIKNLKNDESMVNFPAASKTTQLSAHNKFGTLSIREFYYEVVKQFGREHKLIKELYWRDFFTQIAFYFPHVFEESFLKKYTKIKWNHNAKDFNAWCKGETGFPIIDAGMRELNSTGYLCNRLRMLVASFLVKDLHLDWRLGEKYFAQKLIDYDPAVNNGNWQWIASTGCDAQPYFRIFNPWLQQKKYDPECQYIKHWIPELADVPANVIHKLFILKNKIPNYPTPMVDHERESKLAKLMYKKCI